jgi:hypothetical protein
MSTARSLTKFKFEAYTPFSGCAFMDVGMITVAAIAESDTTTLSLFAQSCWHGVQRQAEARSSVYSRADLLCQPRQLLCANWNHPNPDRGRHIRPADAENHTSFRLSFRFFLPQRDDPTCSRELKLSAAFFESEQPDRYACRGTKSLRPRRASGTGECPQNPRADEH